MCFGALRAPWGYNTDRSGRRDADKNEILVLLLPKLLVSGGKQGPREAESPRRSEAERSYLNLRLFALHPAVSSCSGSLSHFSLILGITFQWPVSPELSPLPHSLDSYQENLQPVCRRVPQLRLPKPSALSALCSHLWSRKIKILDIFNKTNWGKNQRISREEFIMSLKMVSVSRAPSELP